MCRRNQLRGWCLCAFGLGLMLGNSLESWLVCSCGGLTLVCFGLSLLCRRG